ncbi:Fur family transcriptional regulator [Sporanaerobacter acetigenes]|uniref:Fe2+ or Zn2+ uptake regulation protein n=1 Tax=Sporanaerobacter acetigenes DSM 13106 TaxID=1123281 RepID=A0A1M5XAQ2_9FIRM|nr:Fur family transcriptional regulator [Sporanaerobacter acetigenes]SHH96283.1 Fe2+ or Zn2+ uptake regulation protein [Sporanaerobacter acetigenes DSM 13106]
MEKFNDYSEENFSLIKDLIEDAGYKMTYQRREILMEFMKNEEEHLSAEEIYNILKHKGIGISTVYRNIKLFVDLEILKEFKFDDTNYYELKMYARKPLHIHFKCEKCGTIKDIVGREIILKYLKTNNLIEEKYDVEINDVDIMFRGLCDNCIDRR